MEHTHTLKNGEFNYPSIFYTSSKTDVLPIVLEMKNSIYPIQGIALSENTIGNTSVFLHQ